MATLRYDGQSYTVAQAQTVLDCLTANGIPVPFSCRAGVCQSCMMRATAGTPPVESQRGLRDSLRSQNYFLPCICEPDSDLEIAASDGAYAPAASSAVVARIEALGGDIVQLVLATEAPIVYRPGQYINLHRDSRLARSYSLASVPGEDDGLHLHVRRMPGGRVSAWIHDDLRIGDRVEIRGPGGECCYVPGQPEQGILLIGTGSGLAPLFGIIRDALAHQHRGPIRLFHGSRVRSGLYLGSELTTLARQHANFDYVPCVSGDEPVQGQARGRADQVALETVTDLKGWRVYLCGHPAMVQSARRRAYLAGASLQHIHADAFHATPGT